jgi:hypothetical protein
MRRVARGLFLQVWETSSVQSEIPKQFEDMLLEFEGVFQELIGLPLSRSHGNFTRFFGLFNSLSHYYHVSEVLGWSTYQMIKITVFENNRK